MAAYEVRFYRDDGGLSVVCLANFASDHHAISSTRLLLDTHLPAASVWDDGRMVGQLVWSASSLAA